METKLKHRNNPETSKRYRENNKEKIKKINKDYRERNRKKENERSKNWHYQKAFGGMRDIVLKRDNWACVKCGMTQEQHIVLFSESITIDHIDKDRNNNSLGNLQTLCVRCHVWKDNQDIFVKRGEHRSPRTEFKKGELSGINKKKQKAVERK